MQRDIWDANGAIPMLGPVTGPSTGQSPGASLERSTSQQLGEHFGQSSGQSSDESSGQSSGESSGESLGESAMHFDEVMEVEEPVDPTAVAAVELLSPREREVLQELVDGRSHEVAAEDLYISPHTFRTHVKNILTKLGAHSSIEAVSIAVCAGVRPTRMHENHDAPARDSGRRAAEGS